MEDKIEVLNVLFNPCEYNEIINYLEVRNNRNGYICLPDLYNILLANEDIKLNLIYKESTLTLPDGKPSLFFLKWKGFKKLTTISGYWLCRKLLKTDFSHYFYGTTPENLKLMRESITNEFPSAKVLGYKSPPLFRADEIESNEALSKDIDEILALKPDFIWIGISSPKQDLLMNFYSTSTEGTVMIGVGAVFDYFAGTAYMGPEWLKKLGFRWLYQLLRDPKRYYKRMGYIFYKLPQILIKNSFTK